jgi:hypothetical protein
VNRRTAVVLTMTVVSLLSLAGISTAVAEPSDHPAPTYMFRNAATGLCLQHDLSRDDGHVMTDGCWGGLNQTFSVLRRAGNPGWWLHSLEGTGECLLAEPDSAAPGGFRVVFRADVDCLNSTDPLTMWERHGELWVNVGARAATNSTLVLALGGGNDLHLWPLNGSKGQSWVAEESQNVTITESTLSSLEVWRP